MYEVSEFVFLCKLNSDLNSCFFYFFFYANKKKLLLTLLLYTVKVATNNFSDANKLGEGGFVVVYNVNITYIIINLKRDNLMSKDQLHDSSRLLIQAVCIQDSHIKSKKWNCRKG